MVVQYVVAGILIIGAYISLTSIANFVTDTTTKINTLEDLWKFRLEYIGLKGVQVIDLYDVGCYNDEISRSNNCI